MTPIWYPYAAVYPGPRHTVTGDLRVARGVYSPQLANTRDLLVWLPPGYDDSTQRYPVLYVHDGQNVFDAATSFAGEWEVDETLTALSAEGREAIAVGIPNLDAEHPGARLDEYSPYPNATLGHGGQGDRYLAFLCETVKPLIDASFRTRPDRAHTGIMGSSMGGLISLHGLLTRGDVFSFAGVFSPAFWFAGEAIFGAVDAAPSIPGRVYLDIGTAELGHAPPEQRRPGVTSQVYLDDARRMVALLRAKGCQDGRDLLYVEDIDAPHHESAWARRLPGALRWWLAGIGDQPSRSA